MEKQNGDQPLDIALTYFKAWSNKDFESAAENLSENITFEMPINAYATKEAFMEAVKFTGMHCSDIKLLAQFGNTEEALLLYDMVLNPIGKMRIAEYFKIHNKKIIKIYHIHDTADLRKAGFDKANS